ADRPLEAVICERLKPPTVIADEVMVMAGTVTHGLVADDALPDLHALDEPDLLELLHHPVHARARDLALSLEQLLLDLDGRERTGLLVEQFEDRAPRAASTIARVAQRARRAVGPGGGLRRHRAHP